MIIDDIKNYNKLVDDYKHYIEIHYQSAYGFNKISQFAKIAKKEVKDQESNLRQLERLFGQHIVEYSAVKNAESKLNQLWKNYDKIKDECIKEKENFEESFKNLLDCYGKVNFMYQYITNKTSYKILVKLNKKFAINDVEEPEKYPVKTRYTEEEYNELTSK